MGVGDSDPTSRNMDVEALLPSPGSRTQAILPVDLYGHPANMAAIMAIAREHGIRVVEHVCLELGSTVEGIKVGTLAYVSTGGLGPPAIDAEGLAGDPACQVR